MVCEEKVGAERWRSCICAVWTPRPHSNAGRRDSTDKSPGIGPTESGNKEIIVLYTLVLVWIRGRFRTVQCENTNRLKIIDWITIEIYLGQIGDRLTTNWEQIKELLRKGLGQIKDRLNTDWTQIKERLYKGRSQIEVRKKNRVSTA